MFIDSVIHIIMNTDEQIRSDLLELSDKSNDQIGLFELIKEYEDPLACKVDDSRRTMSIRFMKHSCNEIGCKRITFQKRDLPTEATTGALDCSRFSKQNFANEEMNENISCLFSFNHQTFHEEDLTTSEKVYLMMVNEYIQNSRDENLDIMRTITHSSIFNKIISSFENEEIENNFYLSYIDQRIYKNHKFQVLKRRKCLTYDLCEILDFMTQPNEIGSEEYRRLEKASFFDFLNLSQYYALCEDSDEDSGEEGWGSLISARIILETDSIRNYLPILLEKGSQENFGIDVTDEMIDIVNGKLSEIIEIKHNDNADLIPDKYKLVGIYTERDDGEIFSETFVLFEDYWINLESQFCIYTNEIILFLDKSMGFNDLYSSFEAVREYMTEKQLFPVLLMYK